MVCECHLEKALKPTIPIKGSILVKLSITEKLHDNIQTGGELYLRGRLSKAGLLIKIACFVKKNLLPVWKVWGLYYKTFYGGNCCLIIIN
jgi:hypothetical protein